LQERWRDWRHINERSALAWQKVKPSHRRETGLLRRCRRPDGPAEGWSVEDFTGRRCRIRSLTPYAE
jgi:hypothetical protein